MCLSNFKAEHWELQASLTPRVVVIAGAGIAAASIKRKRPVGTAASKKQSGQGLRQQLLSLLSSMAAPRRKAGHTAGPTSSVHNTPHSRRD